MKQRVELLEKESSGLAERLVRGQVDLAEGEEETFALAREVQALRRANVDAQQRLAVAQDEIRSLEMTIAENNSRQSSLEGIEGTVSPKGEELARCLQRELVRARLHAAEREAAERELTARIAELENENKSLRRQRVDNNVAHLQDELIAVKLREAEANLSLKDLRQRVTEISEAWQRHLQEHRQEAPAAPVQSNVVSDIMATPKKLLRAWEGRSADMQKLEEELMTTRIREVEALTELKELRLKVMELETQVQVSTNQLRRQDEEARQLRENLDAALQRERVLQARQREFQHKYTDLESKAKYDSMQANIRNMEDAQRIAELETEVSEYKLKNEVMATEGELRNNMDDSDRVREVQEQVAELKAEVMRLEVWKARALGRTELSRDISFEDDLEEDEKLKLILRRESSTSFDLSTSTRKPT